MSATTNLGGILTAQTVTASVTAAVAATADAVLASLKVPGDASIVEIILTVTDMDSNGTPTHAVDVGDSAGPDTPDDDRFISALATNNGATERASTDGGTNGLLNAIYTYSTTGEQTIEVTNETPAATGAAGTVTLTVIYFRN